MFKLNCKSLLETMHLMAAVLLSSGITVMVAMPEKIMAGGLITVAGFVLLLLASFEPSPKKDENS